MNLRKYTVKDSNNSFIVFIIVNFEFSVASVDHVWSMGEDVGTELIM